MRHLKPSNPSVRPPGSAEADRASADGLCCRCCCWLAAGCVGARSRRQAGGFITAPSITTPCMTYFHNATSSLRASATIEPLRAALAARPEPARQGRLRLMAQPQPGQLDHRGPQLRIAGLRHALLVDDRAAAPGRRRQARIGGDLAAIGELPAEVLPTTERRRTVRRSPSPPAASPPRWRRCRPRPRWPAGSPRPAGPRVRPRPPIWSSSSSSRSSSRPICACQMRRQRPSVAGAQRREPLAPVAPQRCVVALSLARTTVP